MTTDISVVRWDPSQGPGSEYIDEYEYDGGNSSSRLFERSRIKALAGRFLPQLRFTLYNVALTKNFHLSNRGTRQRTKEDVHKMGQLTLGACEWSHTGFVH